MRVGDYRLVYGQTRYRQVPNILEGRAWITVYRDGTRLGVLHPGKNLYRAEQQPSREVAIRSDWLTGEDLFLNADDLREDGSVRLEASVKPLVNLIWLAGLVFVLGSIVTMWPDAREQRRLELRYGEQPVAATA
jgi:cytochrome c-type biogenesis protein CcmF